jgi:hypothetical protein
MIKFIILYCPDITTNLKNKKLSVREVEDWMVSIPSYDIFPTVPLTFDKVFWEAYWPIVNEPVLAVRNAMMKLEKERKENEMKKMSENKWKLEREEADRLEAQKKQEELRLRKRGKNVESPTQLPLPNSPDSTPVKMKSPEKAKLKPSPPNPPNSSNAGNANAPPVSMITFFMF